MKAAAQNERPTTRKRSGGQDFRVALVTGSAKRLGRELALRLAGAGYFTWVHYLTSRKEASQTLAEIEKTGGCGALIKGDIGSKKDIRAMVAKIKKESGRLDVLVNNVGIYRTGDLLSYEVEDFEATLQTNLIGVFYLIQQALPLFATARAGAMDDAARADDRMGSEGSIVNIGYAGIESLTASTHNTAYLISKSGLFILTKSLAQALGPRNIRVNMVSPGILSNSVELPKRPRDVVPLGRLGGCEDVCDAVEFLVGKKSGYITGVNLDVAGGYMLGLKGLEKGRGG